MTASPDTTTPPLVVPGGGEGLRAVFTRRDLLMMLVRKELRVRYRSSILGLGWSYVKPAVQFFAYFIGMGILLRQNVIPDYAVFLFGGLVVLTAFSEAVGNATRSVVANAELVRKIYLPRELFPVASVCVAAVHVAPQVLVLLIGALAAGWRPDVVGVLSLMVGLVLTGMLALGLGLILSAVNVFFRDTENVVDLVLTVLVWGSPVLYTWHRVADLVGQDSPVLTLYQANPLTVAVELVHRGSWAGASPGNIELIPTNLPTLTLVALGCAALTIVIGAKVFARLSGRMAQEL